MSARCLARLDGGNDGGCRRHHQQAVSPVGFKPAGGVSNARVSLDRLALMNNSTGLVIS
ncbi:hypothetical protein ACFFTN_06305 [Aminobacter aganoensis]|uniref:Uncharacterized protein n=1 Tax=Aminobacter aganoensis TaxID=83264 RepID=A0A7X0F4P5_9HYPH|nr:hypothetical protein [Aminobacter aganoensis]MBB6353047.1 hypothetical protein [Aminobacter aganoensis]